MQPPERLNSLSNVTEGKKAGRRKRRNQDTQSSSQTTPGHSTETHPTFSTLGLWVQTPDFLAQGL